MAAAPKVKKREGVRVQCIHNGHIVSFEKSNMTNGINAYNLRAASTDKGFAFFGRSDGPQLTDVSAAEY